MSIRELEKIWAEFDNTQKNEHINKDEKINTNGQEWEYVSICKNCSGDIGENNVCYQCGFSLREERIELHNVFETCMPVTSVKPLFKSKITKMQEWYMWSNNEKNEYKLKVCVQELCKKLKIADCLVGSIVETVILVMNVIKNNDGTKRARVKQGIILVCIHYVSKDTSTPYSYSELTKRLSLDIKYVTRAERLILELINAKKLNIDKDLILQNLKPFDYIINTIKQKYIKINPEILDKVKSLIEICDDNDLLLDHTPLSIGVCCFYYILKMEKINVDIKLFAEMYDLSLVTVVKTYNKLKVYEKQILELL
jgi:transcription initiation factor TFIIIB Brf1 subunit/transcription initiation factor TFIIB